MSLTTDDAPPAVAKPALAAGTVIDGRYRIEARLGAGGAGTVFRCTDLELGTAVALKVLASDGDLARWRREVALARKITDRNVCRVHDLGEADDFRFVTMELVEGVGLRDKIGAVSPAEARDLIAQLVTGTAAIHTAGIVHRDLKPENVVVEPSGRLVIVDFGIAKNPTTSQATRPHQAVGPSPNLTAAGFAIGTPRYMSPEQAVGEQVDARADIWALGLIAHELIVGGLPPLGSYGPVVDDALDQRWPGGVSILRRCLAFDAEDRFADANALRAALANVPTQQAAGATAASAARQPPVETGALRTVDIRTPATSQPPSSAPAPSPSPPAPAQPIETGPLHRTVDIRASRTPPSNPVPRDAISPTPGAPPPSPAGSPPTPASGSNKLAFAIAATGAIGVISFIVVKAVRKPADPAPPAVTAPATPDTPTSMVQLTTTADAQWPAASPTSVALDPTGKQFAYTTGDGKLHVRALAGGAATDWPVPTVKPHDTVLTLSSPRVVGWYPDGALAITGATTSSLYLIKLRADGTSDLRMTAADRFRVAVSPTGKVAIADRSSVYEQGGDAHGTAHTDEVIALAWVGDKQLAWIQVSRAPASEGDATLVLEGTPLWTGHTELLIDPLLAAVGDRLVFSTRANGRTTIVSIEPATKKLTTIEELEAHVGAGTAANGTLVLVKGESRDAIQIRDRYGNRTALAHDANVRGTNVAGYTSDGAAVFRAGEQIVTAQTVGANSKSWHVTPWPGTTTADIPLAIAGADLLVRDAQPRAQPAGSDTGATWQLARIAPDGTRTKLAKLDHAVAVHCANGCVVQQRDGNDTFSELDPATGAVGRNIYHHATWATGFAVSPTLLVLAGGPTVLPIDRATGAAMMKPYPASIETRWRAVAIDDSGDLWTSAAPLDTVPYGFAKARANAADGATGWSRPSNLGLQKADALRWFGEAAMHGIDTDLRIAVATTELRLEIWRADHLAH